MGIDIRHEFLIASLKSIQWIIFNLWYLGVILVLIVGTKIYLARKFKITTADELVYFVISLINKDKCRTVIYLDNDSFPKDFVWSSPTEFTFGKFGSITFREGNNANRNAFQLLTEAKGEEVRVKKLSSLLDIPDNQTRVTMNNLSQRLQKYPKLAPFVDIVTTNSGGYKLAIKSDILKQ